MTESGVYPTVDTTGIIPTVGIRSGVIGLIGQVKLKSGSTYTAFDDSTVGDVIDLNGNNYQAWIEENADFTGTDKWVASNVVSNTGSYDQLNAGIRAIELIFKANGNAQIKFFPLKPNEESGSEPTAESTTDQGLSKALTEMLKYTEITWVHVAGKVPLSAVQTHVETASGSTYGAERIYVAGLDFAHIYDSSMSLDVPTDYTSLKNDNGRTIVFATRSAVDFVYDYTGASTRLVGGNFLSAYYLGLLTARPSYRPILRIGYPYKQVTASLTEASYSATTTTEFIIPTVDRESLVDDRINYVRQQNGMNFFEIGRTFSTTSSAYERITTRRIMDYVIKSVRSNLYSYLAKNINSSVLIAANAKMYNVLNGLYAGGYINNNYEANVYATTQDIIDGKIEANITVSPVNYIGYIMVNIKTV